MRETGPMNQFINILKKSGMLTSTPSFLIYKLFGLEKISPAVQQDQDGAAKLRMTVMYMNAGRKLTDRKT